MAPALSFKTSAPGSLMLLGEYAVLNGHPALVAAINQSIHVTLTPHETDDIHIYSKLAGHHTTRETLAAHPKLAFIMTALQQAAPLPSGFTLTVESEFSSTMGLGSSAAVTVATCEALNQWLSQALSPERLWQQVMRVIHSVQGKGSGADAAASITGGIICFDNKPLTIKPIDTPLTLSVVFSGNKVSTSEALKTIRVTPQWEKAMSDLTEQATLALNDNNRPLLGDLFNQGQALMTELGVSNDTLNQLTQTLCEDPGIFGAKISGSGFGDCVIGLGKLRDKRSALNTLDIDIGLTGVQVHA